MSSRLYPPSPVPLTAWSQLRGLEEGELVAQAKFDGRRAVLLPGGERYYKSGKEITQRPWRDLELPQVPFALDLELMRDGYRVLDVMVAAPFVERHELALSHGLAMSAWEVRSVGDLNAALHRFLATGECDGGVIKRRGALYPRLPFGVAPVAEWLKYKRPIRERSTQHNQRGEKRR
ncbi:MAG: hypothetical protein GY772_17575 [bacterium]|nr:hypothetical protein [bacterium]